MLPVVNVASSGGRRREVNGPTNKPCPARTATVIWPRLLPLTFAAASPSTAKIWIRSRQPPPPGVVGTNSGGVVVVGDGAVVVAAVGGGGGAVAAVGELRQLQRQRLPWPWDLRPRPRPTAGKGQPGSASMPTGSTGVGRRPQRPRCICRTADRKGHSRRPRPLPLAGTAETWLPAQPVLQPSAGWDRRPGPTTVFWACGARSTSTPSFPCNSQRASRGVSREESRFGVGCGWMVVG